MNKQIDKKIMDKAYDEKFQVPLSYTDKVNNVLGSLPDKAVNKKYMRLAFEPAVIILIAVVVVSTVTVFATKDMLQDRLHSMSGEEKKKYVEEVQKSNVEADTYSRELTYNENVRMEELMEAYEKEGKFPENQIKQVEEESDAQKGTLTFVIRTSKFILPERELTDEELLEIIDFNHKIDYSMNENSKAIQKATATESVQENEEKYNKLISKGGITKDGAIDTARSYVNKVYEVDSSEYKSRIEFDDEEKEYYVCLLDSINNRKFEVWINAETGVFEEIAWFEDADDKNVDIKVNEKEYTDYYEKLYDLVKNKMGLWNDIESVSCYYNEKTGGTHYKADGTLWKSSISYVLKAKGNKCYIINYSCKNKRILYLSTMDYRQYRNSHNKEVEADKMKAGITRKEIKLYEAKDEN